METKLLCLTKCGKLDINSVYFKQVHILGHKERENEGGRERERETREDVKTVTV